MVRRQRPQRLQFPAGLARITLDLEDLAVCGMLVRGGPHQCEAPGNANSNTAFTLALGVGLDFRLAPARMSWGIHADYLTTGYSYVAQEQNIRMSVGPAIHF